jgi:hypothetical protein
MALMNSVAMWRPQIEKCLNEAAAAEADLDAAALIRKELQWSQMLADKGCGMNRLGEVCADTAFGILKDLGCPADQSTVDAWVGDLGCCVASYAQLSMAQAALTGASACPGEFHIGKPCKAPKWKLPKNPPKVQPPMGKGKKAAIGVGAAIGGLVGLGLVGAALRRRKQATAKPKHTGDVAMTPAVVAV